jgi:hypothetical protein
VFSDKVARTEPAKPNEKKEIPSPQKKPNVQEKSKKENTIPQPLRKHTDSGSGDDSLLSPEALTWAKEQFDQV